MAAAAPPAARRPPAAPRSQTGARLWPRWVGLGLVLGLVTGTHLALDRDGGPRTAPDDAQARAAAPLLQAPTAVGGAVAAESTGRPAAVLSAAVADLPAERRLATGGGLVLTGAPLTSRPVAAQGFVRRDARDLGLAPRSLPPLYQALLPGVNEFAPLAAGDVDGDGRTDVVLTDARGVRLHRGTGTGFAEQALSLPVRDWLVTELALADLTGDARPELVVCGWRQGCRSWTNVAGDYRADAVTALRHGAAPAVHALAFGDVDRDGDLDVLTGTSSGLPWAFSPRGNEVVLWSNDGAGRFAPEVLPAPPGETLSLLLTDVDDDGWADLLVANDYDEPDVFLRNVRGRFVRDDAGAPMRTTTESSMSLDSGDADGDGDLDLYEGGIAFGGGKDPERLEQERWAPGESCRASYRHPDDRQRCLQLGEFQTAVVRSRDQTGVQECLYFPDAGRRQQCAAAGYLWNTALVRLPARDAHLSAVTDTCGRVPRTLVLLRDVCDQVPTAALDHAQAARRSPDAPRQVTDTNVLALRDGDRFTDATDSSGTGFGGWTWNARFVDLDGDGRQDLFVNQGTRLRFGATSTVWYRNLGGGRFEDRAAAVGLEDHVPTGASLFLDYDLDGRTDVLTQPFDLTAQVWRNELAPARTVRLRLDDTTQHNRAGVGARVELRAPDGRVRLHEVKGSGGFASHDEPVLQVPLGDWPSVASLTVLWPDGGRQALGGLALGPGRYTLVRTAP